MTCVDVELDHVMQQETFNTLDSQIVSGLVKFLRGGFRKRVHRLHQGLELNIFVCVKLVEDSLAVLPLRMLCETTGHSFSWKAEDNPLLTPKRSHIRMSVGKMSLSSQ